MNKDTLDRYFIKSEEWIINKIKSNTDYTYDERIILSNLYLHLLDKIECIDDVTMLEAYIIQFLYKLRYWKMNRSIFLTEEVSKEKKFIIQQDIEYRNDDYNSEYYNYEGVDNNSNVDFYSLLQENLLDFMDDYNLNNRQRILMRDHFEYRLINWRDYSNHYNQRRTYAYKIKRETERLMDMFKEYLIKKIKD